jgi:hypothetical protein
MKKMLVMIAIFSLLISGLIFNSANAESISLPAFKDIANHWAEKTIIQAQRANLLKGYEDGTFRPNKTVTRGEFAAFLSRTTTQTVTDQIDIPFADVKGHWSEADVQKDLSLGFIQAADYPNGFSPDKVITRGEIAKWMANGLSSRSEDYKQALLDMKDTYVPVREMFNGKLAAVDIPIVGLMLGTGLLTGYPDLSFGLEKNTTRAEVATILLRYIDVENKKADDFLGLRELREVGTMGTNLTTLTPYKYGQTIENPDKKLTFKNIENKKITFKRNGAGSMVLHRMIIVDAKNSEDYTGIYGKMFMGKDSFIPDNTYLVFTEITVTPAVDKFDMISFTGGTLFTTTKGYPIRSENFIQTGLQTFPYRNTTEHFKKGVPLRMWLCFNISKTDGGQDVETDDGSIFMYYIPANNKKD